MNVTLSDEARAVLARLSDPSTGGKSGLVERLLTAYAEGLAPAEPRARGRRTRAAKG